MKRTLFFFILFLFSLSINGQNDSIAAVLSGYGDKITELEKSFAAVIWYGYFTNLTLLAFALGSFLLEVEILAHARALFRKIKNTIKKAEKPK